MSLCEICRISEHYFWISVSWGVWCYVIGWVVCIIWMVIPLWSLGLTSWLLGLLDPNMKALCSFKVPKLTFQSHSVTSREDSFFRFLWIWTCRMECLSVEYDLLIMPCLRWFSVEHCWLWVGLDVAWYCVVRLG